MNHGDTPYYYTRKQLPDHVHTIARFKVKPEEEYARLIRAAFDHQPACFSIQKGSSGESQSLTADRAAFFYRSCYEKPRINLGQAHPISDEMFLKQLTTHNSDKNRNRLLFLLGEVGAGKTAYINYLITVYGQTLLETNNVWFVRFDMQAAGNNRLISSNEFLQRLAKKTARVCRTHAPIHSNNESVLKALTSLNDSLGTSDFNQLPKIEQEKRYLPIRSGLKNLIAAVASTGRRLILLLDNADYLCRAYDRVVFTSVGIKEDEHILNDVVSFVNLFFHDSNELGDLGVNVLFSVRFDSFKILNNVGLTNVALPGYGIHNDESTYYVEDPPWKKAVEARYKLLRREIDEISKPGKQEQFEEVTNLIQREIHLSPKRERPFSDQVRDLTSFRLRELIDFFGDYSWVRDPSDDAKAPIERFADRPTLGLITYMLKGRRLFSQTYSCFPNMFLINNVIKSPLDDTVSRHTHAHSYWLKVLIGLYLLNKPPNVACPPERLFDIFNADGNGYEQHLIEVCLGSLHDVSSSNVIEVEWNKFGPQLPLQITDVALTSRGKALMDRFLWRYEYLELICDDFQLPLPTAAFKDFSYPSKHYGYVVAGGGRDYWGPAREMVMHKSHEVLLFLEVLKIAWQEERRWYAPVFDGLEAASVRLPDLEALTDSVVEQVRGIADAFGVLPDMERIKNRVWKLRTEGLESEMKKAYAAGFAARRKGS